VEVYTFEDLTFSIDVYTVAKGDNLAGILQARGLWPSTPDAAREAQIIRLVKSLNPAIANPDLIAPGQELYLPTPQVIEETPPTPPPAPKVEEEEEVDPPGVVSYPFNDALKPESANQAAPPAARASQTTKVPIAPVDEPENLDEGEYSLRTTPASASRPPAAMAADLEMAPDGTVFRTVTVRKGDTLEKLLRREGVDPKLIYRTLIKVTLSLNPELRDPNVIAVGAELRIPSLGGYDDPGPTTALAGPATSGPKTPPTKAKPAAGKKKGAKEAPTPAPSRGKFTISTKRLPPAPMPTADAQNAKTILGVIFTRLGENFVNKGRLFLPLDEPPHFDVDMGRIPVIELTNGRRIVLDLQRALSPELIKRFRDKYQDYLILQPTRGEPMAKVLERLWPMCGYYRVYDKNQTFEGGTDIKLKLAADWLIWPTAEAWNRGQPVVINLAPAPDTATPKPWVKFLASHGVTVIDLYKGLALADSTKAPTPINNFTVIEVDSANPSAFAEALIKSFGFSPRLGVRVDQKRGRIVTGGAEIGPNLAPPVFWEAGSARNVLEYGDLSSEDLEVLKKNNFRVISSGKDSQSVLKSILAAQSIKLGQDLVLNGSSPGGPVVSLTISGQSFAFNGRSYLFTNVEVPDNLVALDPNQNTVVLRYQGAAPPRAEAKTASEPPAITLTDEGQPPEESGQVSVSDIK
jgi:LysM repeat protein